VVLQLGLGERAPGGADVLADDLAVERLLRRDHLEQRLLRRLLASLDLRVFLVHTSPLERRNGQDPKGSGRREGYSVAEDVRMTRV
jgi:hypothetical protein